MSVQSPESSEFVVTDLGDSFPADQTFSGGETTRLEFLACFFKLNLRAVTRLHFEFEKKIQESLEVLCPILWKLQIVF